MLGAVLAKVSLSLQRGTITALVGRSGAGKSTVASLLSRFYRPETGEVLLNGRSSSTFTRGEWARAVALVSQETNLFEGETFLLQSRHLSCGCPGIGLSPAWGLGLELKKVCLAGTIRENIAYGLWGHASQEHIQAAAEMANAHEFIRKLPQGYDTFVGKRGVLLSGGQRQRIALARALAKVSSLLIQPCIITLLVI